MTTAADLDAADPLAHLRDRFVGAASDLVYFDGNSLGRPLAATAGRMRAFVEEEWGGRLIRGWDEGCSSMSLGEHATLTCTGDYAYGPKGFPAWGIGPNATLVFEARAPQHSSLFTPLTVVQIEILSFD